MTRRARRGWAVWLAPLACVAAVLVALFWAGSLIEGGGAAGEGADVGDAASADEGSAVDGEDGTDGDGAAEDVDDGALVDLVDRASEAFSGGGSVSSTETFLADLASAAEAADADEVALVAWEKESDLVGLASDVLSTYEGVDDASLVTSGYLDLEGDAWGAVVQGGSSWVDIVVVSTEDDETSTARVVRLVPDSVDEGS